MKTLFSLLLLFVSFFINAEITPQKDSVFFRVIDTGAGLATLLVIQSDTDNDGIVESDENFFIVFDTGHWNTIEHVSNEIISLIPDDEKIDLMFLSHPDSDHLAATSTILSKVKTDTIIRTGFQRPDTGTWAKMQDAIRLTTAKNGLRDVDLKYDKLKPGTVWRFGEATLELLSGFSEPPKDWDLGFNPDDSEFISRQRNAISLVVKLSYQGKHILITGDAVGRKDGPPKDSRSIATEKYLLDNNLERPINADILIAPHHGSDNGSSKDFIKAVSPKWVVFSAGHSHGHPKKSVVNRYKSFLSPDPIILTTDFGDNDEGKDGWSTGDCKDASGDDGITFLIRKQGNSASISFEQDQSKPCIN